MKPRTKQKAIVAAGVAVLVPAAFALAVYITDMANHSANGPSGAQYMKVVRAAVAYRRDLDAHGTPIPVSVSLKDLLDLRFLSKEDLIDFKDTQVTVAMTARPGLTDALISVSTADGFQVTLMGDGSVQQSKR